MPSPDPDLVARIARLFVYPVKSCAGVALDQAVLTPTGLDLDRAWMVVDNEGEFVSQRELPRMALIRPQIKTHEVVLRAPGMLALHLDIESVEQPARVQLWDRQLKAYDMGNTAAQWFSDFLGTRLRLVRFDPDERHLSDARWTGGLEAENQFSDGYPLLVLSEAALVPLNAKLAAAGQPAVGIERFRPNLVLDGIDAHAEDHLELLRVDTGEGVVELKLVKPCPRCPIPNVDPSSGEVQPFVVDALMGYRQDARLNGAVSFGMNAIVLSGVDQVLRVGQPASANYHFD
ncbi:MAG TPA: MOSC N-terminal beta barrel domain-containing protein [Lautropia sp.]|nr:MOSC N-terminal beta barrel domain-containing protein [Lautropia sp.]